MPIQQSPLTREQLKQLTEEYQELENWTVVRDFCGQVYGEGVVAKFEIETYGEYNDEGGTDYRVESVTAADAQGEVLGFDLSLPFWVHVLAENDDENEDEEAVEEEDKDEDDRQDAALDALKDWYCYSDEDKAIKAANKWVEWSDLPCDEHEGGTEEYDLTTSPTISFPVVIALHGTSDQLA